MKNYKLTPGTRVVYVENTKHANSSHYVGRRFIIVKVLDDSTANVTDGNNAIRVDAGNLVPEVSQIVKDFYGDNG